jgi:probable rRNA maturation factor
MSSSESVDEKIDLTIAIQYGAWQQISPNFDDYVQKVCHTVLLHQWTKLQQYCKAISSSPVQIALVFTDAKEIRQLNKQFRGKDYPTNVLSFAADMEGLQSEFGEVILGDIIFGYEVIELEAGEQGKHFVHHLTHMIVHGLLHLIGYDHVEEVDAEIMEKIECEILSLFNISNPYLVDLQKYDINMLHGA